MAEIKTPPIFTSDVDGDEIVSFTAAHTLSDIVRWIMSNRVDAEEIYEMLGNHLGEHQEGDG